MPTCAGIDRVIASSRPTSTTLDYHLGQPTNSSASRRPRSSPRPHRRPLDCADRARRHRHSFTSSSRHQPRHKFRPASASPRRRFIKPTSTTPTCFHHVGWLEGSDVISIDLPRHLGSTWGLRHRFINLLGGSSVNAPTCFRHDWLDRGFASAHQPCCVTTSSRPISSLYHIGTGLGAGTSARPRTTHHVGSVKDRRVSSSRHKLGPRHQHRAH